MHFRGNGILCQYSRKYHLAIVLRRTSFFIIKIGPNILLAVVKERQVVGDFGKIQLNVVDSNIQ